MRARGAQTLIIATVCTLIFIYGIITIQHSPWKSSDKEVLALDENALRELVEKWLNSVYFKSLVSDVKADQLHNKGVEEHKLNIRDNKDQKYQAPPNDGFFNPQQIAQDLELSFIATPIPGDLISHVKSITSPHKPPVCSSNVRKTNFVYILPFVSGPG